MREPTTSSTGSELTHDVRSGERRPPLEPIFAPQTVAVIGASEEAESVGRTLLWNLLNNPFGGTVYPVNRERTSVLGVKAYPSVVALPEPVDLAIVATPAPTVPGVISECVQAGVRGAIVLSTGFREVGEEGAELEREILERARRGRLRLVGPNCLGVMRPVSGLNATFAREMALAGRVGFISQSGALGTAILDWSLRENVGFSSFISVGSMVDVGWGDLIYYLRDDPHTRSILIYMETIGDARSFLSAAREVALIKPIIVLKVGHTEAAAKAAASHTGALTGTDEVLDAAFRRCGVLRVNDIADLFEMAEVLAKQPHPKGPRLTVVTNAGGPGVLATDTLIAGGGELAELSAETMESLGNFLPAPWSPHNNPVDILGEADPERYAKTVEVVREDKASDGLLVVLTPQDMTDPTATAQGLVPYAKLVPSPKKRRAIPILASWMGGGDVAAGEEILNQGGIPTFDYPDTAARVFNYMWRYTYNLRSIYETPELAEEDGLDYERAKKIISGALEEDRTLLTEWEAKELLAACGVPTVETMIAHNEEEAVRHAEDLGYPAVLKLYSKTIIHKTDVGGVELDLEDANALRDAYRRVEKSVREKAGAGHFEGVTVQPMISTEGYELIVGSSVDPQFGPVVLFGSGGQLVEVYKDRAFALPPLTTTLARRMMEQTQVYEALKGVRGRAPVDLASLEKLLVRFSQLVVEQPRIKEVDINPLLASPERFIALDARIVLHGPDIEEKDLPKPAIRPYPKEYVSRATLKDGTSVTIRPIGPEDESQMVKFHEPLSERSVYMRYFGSQRLNTRISHESLRGVCFIDYDREMALVAEHDNPETGERHIVGIGHLSRDRVVTEEAELTLLVSDSFQHRGLGSILLGNLIEVGRAEGLRRITADILRRNRPMRRLAKKFGFRLRRDPEGGLVEVELDL